MIRTEKICYVPYHNETYHGNYIYRGHPSSFILRLGNQPAEGIMIMYYGNPFGLRDYRTYKVDKDGNPIK